MTDRSHVDDLRRKVVVAGVGYSEIGRDLGKSEGYLTLQAAANALADAGLTSEQVDGVVGYPDRISTPFEGPSVSYVQRALGLRGSRYWQATGWGPGQLAAVVNATYAIASGGADVVLCFRGHLRQTKGFYLPSSSSSHASYEQAFKAPYGAPAGAPRWALWAQRYLFEHGLNERHLGSVVLTCRENAQRNPRAVWNGTPLTMDDYLGSRMISSPLRILDCDYPVDGAVCLVLARADRVPDLRKKPVYIESIGHATGPDPEWDQWPDLSQQASGVAAEQMWSRTPYKPTDVDVAEVYDGFSHLALCWLEDLGFCNRGEAGDFLLEGRGLIGGDLPICTDGGQLGGGRLHGFGKLAEAVLQLRGTEGVRQVEGAEVAVAELRRRAAGVLLLVDRMTSASEPRTAVVVGGSGGIGRAAAARLAETGVERVVLVYRGNHAAAQSAAAELAFHGCEPLMVQADITTESGLDALQSCVRANVDGRVDVLVYSAGYRSLASGLERDPVEWQRALAVGVDGFVGVVQVVAPTMPHGGRIVAISGLSGIRAYSTSHMRMGVAKAALQHAVRYLALELAPRGITANAVAFGAVLTEGVAQDLGPQQYETFVVSASQRIPMGRVPQPEEVIGVIGFLASPESAWITGQLLVADGGETLS